MYAGTYKCRITDYNGKWVETKPIKVTTVPFKITSQPKGGTVVNAKQPLKLSVGVTGGKAPYTYEWTGLKSGKVGENSATYNALYADSYRCKITDSKGDYVISSWAGVNLSLLQMTNQSSEYVYLSSDNGTANIFVTVKGGKTPYTYNWTCNGNNINKNSDSITVSEAGNYKCVVTDALGDEVKSNVDGINVMKPFKVATCSVPRFWNDFINESDKLKVWVSGGTGRYTYNWQRKVGNNWVDVGCYTAECTVYRKDINDNTDLYTTARYGKVNWYDDDKKWIVTTTDYAYNTYRCVIKTIGNHGNGNVVSTITTDELKVMRYLKETTSYHDYWY